jgi:hypothetical protein
VTRRQQVNALKKGEVDIIEALGFESSRQGRRRTCRLPKYEPRPAVHGCASTTCTSPFDNAKVQAGGHGRDGAGALPEGAGRREGPLQGLRVDVHLQHALRQHQGSDIQGKSNMKKAQELLKASGYDGTPIVIMKPTDLASIQKLPDVAALLLRQAGFKVDLQAMDWQTLVGRRAKKDAPDGGRLAHVPDGLERRSTSGARSPTRHGHAGREVRLVRLGQRRQAGEAAQPVHARHRRGAKKKLADQMHSEGLRVRPRTRRWASTCSRWPRARTSAGSSSGNGNIYWNLKK